jgi:hypothetical protein
MRATLPRLLDHFDVAAVIRYALARGDGADPLLDDSRPPGKAHVKLHRTDRAEKPS